jgi:hypothetical protein
MRILPLFVLSLALIAPSAVARQTDGKAPAPLDGKWTMTVKAPPPHGDAAMGLELKQDGRKVTATLTPPHGGTIPLEGELDKGTLSLAAPSKDGDPQLTMTAKVNADGSLSGFLSGARGDMTWAAVRVKEKPASDKSRP